MSYRPLELTLISAKDLDKVNLFSKMEVYAVVMIAGDPRSRKKTHTDRDGGRNPTWNATFIFNVMEFDLDRCVLHVVLKAEKAFGDREIGEVHVPVKELLNGWKKDAGAQFLSYQCFHNRTRPRSDHEKPQTLDHDGRESNWASSMFRPPARP